jgi:Restriction endonuclease
MEDAMSDEMHIFALQGDADWAEAVRTSLLEGVGRFGWSYIKDDDGSPLGDADLRRLQFKIDGTGWNTLTENEKDRYQNFMLDFKEGDWVVYINIPKWGRCTVARVTGPYYWELKGADFNHCFPVDPKSVRDFDRNNAIVHPALSARLKLQGRWWHIYAEDEFKALLTDLDTGGVSQNQTEETNVKLLNRELEPLLQEVTKRVQHTHPNYALEALLELVFKAIPGVHKVVRQGGAGDHGADLIVEFEGGLPHPALQTQHTCVVQAKSYEGKLWETRAVEDIRRAFAHYPAADMGLIVSTAASSTPAVDDAIEKLRETSGKRVEMLIGSDLARFILRFGGTILGVEH